MKQIFYIGGSPCSGKSTVAGALAARYGMAYFRVDDDLEALTVLGAEAGLPVCRRLRSMTPEETWMRPPQEQCCEELAFYREIAPFVMKRLAEISAPRVIAEGAAFLPCLMTQAEHYLAITPTRAFQVSRYRERPWVPHVLQDCSDRGRAFENWMERDALFAEDVRRQCARYGLCHLLTDGSVSPEERLQQVASYFRLGTPICQE